MGASLEDPEMTTLIPALVLALLVPTGQAARQKPGVLDVRVTDQTGAVLVEASVRAEGSVSREGTTSAEGGVLLRNMPGGAYRLRFDRDGYVPLEKEVTLKAGATLTVHAALTPAPAAPPPAPEPEPEPPAPAVQALTAGEPRVVSIPDFAEAQLITNKETTKETPIGCSGATATRLLQARQPIASHAHADQDEVLYVIAGDATLTLGGKEHRLSPGWLAIVPRGMQHTIARRGGGPVILISTIGGQPCS